MYDFLIVGAGFYGATCARLLHDAGFQVLVVEQRSHIGGNCYTREVAGIAVHEYGAHIFHTSNEKVWNFINQFATFNRYTNSPVANYKNEFYQLPFNMATFYKLWGTATPRDAYQKIEEQRKKYSHIIKPKNLEEMALSLVGDDIYTKLIKGYTEKQWGKPATELPAFIIKRLPLRFTYDNNYFNDRYQGIPIEGYTSIFNKLLEGVDVLLNCDFLKNRSHLMQKAKHIIFSGCIDRYFEYNLGHLEWRSLRFHHELMKNVSNFQGNAVLNYTDREIPYTRSIEHKHFTFGDQSDTVVTYEYPQEWTLESIPYYPVNTPKNQDLYLKYEQLAKKESFITFGGRLGRYVYYNMDQVIDSAMRDIEEIRER